MEKVIQTKEGDLYITFSFLRENHHVSKNTLKAWRDRKEADIMKLAQGNAIRYHAIPELSRTKYSIGPEDYLLSIATKQTSPEDYSIKLIADHLGKVIIQNSPSFTSMYRGNFSETHAMTYSRLHALYLELNTLKESTKIKTLHKAVLTLAESPLKVKSYSKFSNKLSKAFEAITRDKLEEYVPSKKHKNSNREKLHEEDEAILIELFKDPIKLSKKECHLRYSLAILTDFGKEPVSYKTAARFLNSNRAKAKYFISRYGKGQFDKDIAIHAKRTKGNHSFILAAADGIQLGRSVQFKDKTVGQISIWIYYDWFSGYILGHAINRTETFELIRAGYRDALKKQKGMSFKELSIDTKWSLNKETAKLFEKAGVYLRKKKPYNAKDLIAERCNQEFNKIHRQFDEGWASITNRHPDKVHNPEHLRKIRPLSLSEIHSVVTDVVEVYNFEKSQQNAKSRYDICMGNICENPKIINELDQVTLFGDTRIVTVRNGYFEFNINTRKYEYEVSNYHNHWDNLDKMRLRIYYDLSDMEHVEAFYPEQDVYLGRCAEVKKFNPSKSVRDEADTVIMSGQMKREAQLEKKFKQAEEMHMELVNTFDITTSIQKAGQDRYKAAHEHEIAKLYKRVDLATMEAKELVSVEAPGLEKSKSAKKSASLKPIIPSEDNQNEDWREVYTPL